MKVSYKKGFTLLELLVVIAVIGILAAVIMVSVSSSKTKAQVANIKQQFDSMRSQSDVYYANNNDYGTGYAYSSRGDKSGTGSEIWVNDNCVTDSGTGIFRRSTTGLGNLINGICKSGASSIIVAVDTDPATKWAIKVTGPGSNYFCEDSSGVLYFRTTSAYNVLNGVCS